MRHGSAAILNYETDYRPCGCEGVWRRSARAISRIFVTNDGRGKTVPNIPFLGGLYGGAMIATNWYPERFNPWKEGVRVATVQVGVAAGINVLKEFAPELKRLFRRPNASAPPPDVRDTSSAVRKR